MEDQHDPEPPADGGPKPRRRRYRAWLWAAAQLAQVMTALAQLAVLLTVTHMHLPW